jgi:Ala-tRNA(Pro) deacylase
MSAAKTRHRSRLAMPATPQDLFAALDALGIKVSTVEHDAAFTVEESRHLRGSIPGAHTKNLFLRDNKRSFFLVTLDEEAEVDLKRLRPLIGAKGGLSFASPDYLMEQLGVRPGAVSPFAVINDEARSVTMVLDQALLAAEVMNAHPLDNTKTTAIAPEDLMTFLRSTSHEPLLIEV